MNRLYCRVMTCHRKVYSLTLFLVFLVLFLFYVDYNQRASLDATRIKATFYSVHDGVPGRINTVSNEGLNVQFVNVLNDTHRHIIDTNNNNNNRNHADDVIQPVTSSIHKFANGSMSWPAIQTTTQVTPSVIRSRAHIVLVVSYMRSGSSLTADIMQHFPKTSYVFEPFHQVVLRTKHRLPLYYVNGTKIKLKPEDITDEFLQNELMKWLDCRLWELDVNSLNDQLHAKFSRSMLRFFTCLRGKPNTLKAVRQCLPDAIDTCKKAKQRLFKFIRLPMRIVKNIISQYPNLQVIHLVRDPRGTLSSQIAVNTSTWDMIDTTSRNFCNKVAEDLNATLYLNYLFPNRSKILLYEKLAENPLGVAKLIYNYTKQPHYRYVLRYVTKLTLTGKKMAYNPFGDTRTNSTTTAYLWRDNINFNHMRTIDHNCDMLYNFIGYQTFTNTADLRNHYKPTMIIQNNPIFITV